MKTTRYFEEQGRRKRPYVDPDRCAEIVAAPLRREVQPNGRVRYWGEAVLAGDPTPRVLRVVTLVDGKTIHNAFFDRGFRRKQE